VNPNPPYDLRTKPGSKARDNARSEPQSVAPIMFCGSKPDIGREETCDPPGIRGVPMDTRLHRRDYIEILEKQIAELEARLELSEDPNTLSCDSMPV
jgi:hypothetical protein